MASKKRKPTVDILLYTFPEFSSLHVFLGTTIIWSTACFKHYKELQSDQHVSQTFKIASHYSNTSIPEFFGAFPYTACLTVSNVLITNYVMLHKYLCAWSLSSFGLLPHNQFPYVELYVFQKERCMAPGDVEEYYWGKTVRGPHPTRLGLGISQIMYGSLSKAEWCALQRCPWQSPLNLWSSYMVKGSLQMWVG